jgi:hypothetical protein
MVLRGQLFCHVEFSWPEIRLISTIAGLQRSLPTISVPTAVICSASIARATKGHGQLGNPLPKAEGWRGSGCPLAFRMIALSKCHDSEELKRTEYGCRDSLFTVT